MAQHRAIDNHENSRGIFLGGAFALVLSVALLVISLALVSPVAATTSQTYVDLQISIASDGRSSVSGSSNVPILDIPVNDSINGLTDALTTKSRTFWLFNLTTTQVVNDSLIKVLLPVDAVINAIHSQQTVYIESDTANNAIMITFIGQDDSLQIAIQYSFKNSQNSPNTVTMQSIFSNPNQSAAIYAIGAATFLTLIGIGTFMYRRQFSPSTRRSVGIDERKLETLRPTLNETQLRIIDALIAAKGAATQNKIHHATGIPKASLSRNIDLLARKQILQKTSGGYTNQITFAAEMKKP